MRKLVTMMAVIALVGLVMAGAAQAGKQDFVLVNATGSVIDKLFVSASATSHWEEDILGKDVLNNGEETHIQFEVDEGHCQWDLKITTKEGQEIYWNGLNLCKIHKITLKPGGIAELE